ncbi:MAG: hypothetical protein M1355_00235 [Patescibacteria group bacterium]|nr:hypothetical protein [Patescibacteria group bacterium]
MDFLDLTVKDMKMAVENEDLGLYESLVFINVYSKAGRKLTKRMGHSGLARVNANKASLLFHWRYNGIFIDFTEYPEKIGDDISPFTPIDLVITYELEIDKRLSPRDYEYRGRRATDIAKVYLEPTTPFKRKYAYLITARTPILRPRKECFELLERLVMRRTKNLTKK